MKSRGNSPMNQLNEAVGQEVIAKLKDDTFYKGTLIDVDGYMNVVIKDATEYLDEMPAGKYEEIYIRGGNLLYIKLNVDK